MNTVHPHLQHNVTSKASRFASKSGKVGSFDWAGQIKLAIVLSVVAAITATTLANRVAEPVLIVGVIVVASFAGWARVQPTAQYERQSERQLIRIPVRHR